MIQSPDCGFCVPFVYGKLIYCVVKEGKEVREGFVGYHLCCLLFLSLVKHATVNNHSNM